MEELWKSFGKHYRISDKGRVYSIKSKRHLILSKNDDGYLKTTLILENNIRKTFSVHVLVAKLFLTLEDYKDLEVNHLDGNKQNNKVQNLEWVSHSDNIKHAWKLGLMKHSDKGRASISKASSKWMTENNPNSRKVRCITTNRIFETMTAAEKWCGLSPSSISRYLTTATRLSCGKHPDTNIKLTWEYLT